MKIAVISDIHSNYPVFKKAYDDAISRGADTFIFLGDYVTDGFDANKVIELIRNTNGYVINGNRETTIINYDKNKDERWSKYLYRRSKKYAYECLSKENLEYLKTLPIYQIIGLADKKICISHSSPYNVSGDVFYNSYDVFDKLIEDYPCDIYLFGHEHKYYYTNYKNKHFVNAGSIGLPTDGLPFKYVMLDINSDVKVEKIDIEYEYSELEKYYKNSEYYNYANVWCNLLLLVMKTGGDHILNFMNFLKLRAKEKNIDISNFIPDDLFNESYYEYIKKS